MASSIWKSLISSERIKILLTFFLKSSSTIGFSGLSWCRSILVWFLHIIEYYSRTCWDTFGIFTYLTLLTKISVFPIQFWTEFVNVSYLLYIHIDDLHQWECNHSYIYFSVYNFVIFAWNHWIAKRSILITSLKICMHSRSIDDSLRDSLSQLLLVSSVYNLTECLGDHAAVKISLFNGLIKVGEWTWWESRNKLKVTIHRSSTINFQRIIINFFSIYIILNTSSHSQRARRL